MYGMSEARRRSGPQAANGGTELETGGFCRFNGSSKDSLAKRDMKSHKRSATGCIVPTVYPHRRMTLYLGDDFTALKSCYLFVSRAALRCLCPQQSSSILVAMVC